MLIRLSYNIVETTSCQKSYIESMINRMRYEIVYNFNLVENIQRVSHFFMTRNRSTQKCFYAQHDSSSDIHICAFVLAFFFGFDI